MHHLHGGFCSLVLPQLGARRHLRAAACDDAMYAKMQAHMHACIDLDRGLKADLYCIIAPATFQLLGTATWSSSFGPGCHLFGMSTSPRDTVILGNATHATISINLIDHTLMSFCIACTATSTLMSAGLQQVTTNGDQGVHS